VRNLFSAIFSFLKKADMLLLFLACACTVYGMVLIGSVTNRMGSASYLSVQGAALAVGIVLYIVFTIIDVDIFADKSWLLFLFSVAFISTLFIWGEAGDSGNRAWLRFGGFGIQPSEIVKLPFVIILAKQIVTLQDRRGINAPVSMLQLVAYFFLFFGLIVVASDDLGSALVFLFIFVAMLFIGGVKLRWFLAGAAALAAVIPLAWSFFLSEGQKLRILAPYDPLIDPDGIGIKWQVNQSRAAIAAGSFTGQGLNNGKLTQSGLVPQQHTDFIFSAAGEELGFVGCVIIVILLMALIIRCIYVGIKSNTTLGMLVCIGIASMFIFQTFENIGMCLGLTPVVGLTLPFFSYGGSSIITNFAAIGIVSGIKMRPKPTGYRRF
jgi:rod shape determining protein RodA